MDFQCQNLTHNLKTQQMIETEQVTFELDSELLEQLKQLCKQSNKTLNELLNEAVEQYIEEQNQILAKNKKV